MKSPAATGPVSLTLFDPGAGGLPFRFRGAGGGDLGTPFRSNYFTVIWIREGGGRYHCDLSAAAFAGPALLFANPYQTWFVEGDGSIDGAVLEFHANFLCIETHHEEVGCNGVLFNQIYGMPVLDCAASVEEFRLLIEQIGKEFEEGGVAHGEVLLSLLKILLIKAARMKLEEISGVPHPIISKNRQVLVDLVDLIERHHRTLHRPHDYAGLLGITPKALGRITKETLGKTLSEVIRERRLKQAKWQLLHTLRPVKEIAAEAGFLDEFYFSRLFKLATGLSPSAYREFETRIRGGRNLSM